MLYCFEKDRTWLIIVVPGEIRRNVDFDWISYLQPRFGLLAAHPLLHRSAGVRTGARQHRPTARLPLPSVWYACFEHFPILNVCDTTGHLIKNRFTMFYYSFRKVFKTQLSGVSITLVLPPSHASSERVSFSGELETAIEPSLQREEEIRARLYFRFSILKMLPYLADKTNYYFP